MGKILFSIIIPSYNSALFIRRCLDSLLKQTYSNWEAIVIDNHSTDDTVSIVKSYGDSRIQCYLIHNEGVIAKSRNYGITFAKGDYVCFLDSDDWWKENKLNTCLLYCNLNEEVFIYHKVTTKKWNAEECSNRFDLQRFHLSCRLFPTPP